MIVYVTLMSNCYHRAGCSYLKTDREIALEEAYIEGHNPCEICKPPTYSGSAKEEAIEQILAPRIVMIPIEEV